MPFAEDAKVQRYNPTAEYMRRMEMMKDKGQGQFAQQPPVMRPTMESMLSATGKGMPQGPGPGPELPTSFADPHYVPGPASRVDMPRPTKPAETRPPGLADPTTMPGGGVYQNLASPIDTGGRPNLLSYGEGPELASIAEALMNLRLQQQRGGGPGTGISPRQMTGR
jgi:hypothetical protein